MTNTSYVSHADLGGQLGHGRVVPEPEGELFHAGWEPTVFALVLAMGATGQWNIDMSRAVRETLPNYADLSYYAIWHAGLLQLLGDRGMTAEDEIAAGRSLRPGPPVARILRAAEVPAALASRSPTTRDVDASPRFVIGDAVRMRGNPVDHHTRLPGYVRGRRGLIERCHGAHAFADARAQGLGDQPQFLYTVVFDASALWADARLGDTVSVDAWESYMEPHTESA